MLKFFSYIFLRCVFRLPVPLPPAFDTTAIVVVIAPFNLAKPFLDALSIIAFGHIFSGT